MRLYLSAGIDEEVDRFASERDQRITPPVARYDLGRDFGLACLGATPQVDPPQQNAFGVPQLSEYHQGEPVISKLSDRCFGHCDAKV